MRALLVDDDELIRRALRRSLMKAPMQLDEAHSVKTGVAALQRVPYDVIVSDQEMGDGLGQELLAEAFKIRPSCRRALMSGRGEVPSSCQATWERFFAK